jgi:uncharacterized membrane protein
MWMLFTALYGLIAIILAAWFVFVVVFYFIFSIAEACGLGSAENMWKLFLKGMIILTLVLIGVFFWVRHDSRVEDERRANTPQPITSRERYEAMKRAESNPE